jgi:hypothetical protein
MEYLNGNKLFIIENTGELDHVYINGHYFYFKTYKYRNSFKKGYLEKMASGQYDLYIKYNVKFAKRQEAQSPYEQPIPDRFEGREATWFCSFQNGPIKNIELDKTGLETLFRDNYPLVKKYIKSNKLKLRKTEDVIKLFAYCNSLKT